MVPCKDLDRVDRNVRLGKAVSELINLFAEMDTDADGRVTLEEMERAPRLLPFRGVS